MGGDFQVKRIRPAPYQSTYDAMCAFTSSRTPDTPDEIWLCEHPPVYTLGLAGQPEHILAPHDIPIVQTDRGGQVTYHGPGQVVAYILMDMRRRNYFVKDYVLRIQQAVVATLKDHGLEGVLVDGAPGVYVHVPAVPDRKSLQAAIPQSGFDGLAKISALGVKVRNHCTYHGVALNVKMDLQPFSWINPCGYEGLQTTDLFTMGVSLAQDGWENTARVLAAHLEQAL